jgi:hypothetical protein
MAYFQTARRHSAHRLKPISLNTLELTHKCYFSVEGLVTGLGTFERCARPPDMPPEFKRASSASEQADQKNQEERNKLLFGETRAWVCGRLLH